MWYIAKHIFICEQNTKLSIVVFRWRNAPALNVKHGKLLFRPHNGVQFSSTNNIRRKKSKKVKNNRWTSIGSIIIILNIDLILYNFLLPTITITINSASTHSQFNQIWNNYFAFNSLSLFTSLTAWFMMHFFLPILFILMFIKFILGELFVNKKN